jgi:hypothetical protein
MPHSITYPNWFEWLKVAINVATFASIVIAYLAYRANLKKIAEDRVRDRDKELLAQVQKSLEWAYNVLTDESERTPPKPNRLNWLTCARHLFRGRKLADQIASPTYRTVYAEVEEYWRHKFYIALSHEELRNWTYFADASEPDWPENIEISSALVIVDFSNWKQGTIDPTDEVDHEALIKNGGGLKGGWAGRGLEGYIVRLRDIRDRKTND